MITLVGGRTEAVALPGGLTYPEDLGQPKHRTAEEYYRDMPKQGANQAPPQRHGTPSVGSGRCGSAATGVPEAWEETLGGSASTQDGAAPGLDRNHADGSGPSVGVPATDGQGPSPSVADWDDGGLSPGEASVIRRLVAQEIARSAGTAPGHLHRLARREMQPERIDWRRELRSIVSRTVTTISGAVDYSYARPSRRQSAMPGVVLPALREPVVRVAVVVDTSASMHDRELGAALEQVDAILKGAGARDGLVVLAVDAKVHAVKQVFRAKDVRLVGGGGTDMAVGIDAASRLRPRPDVVIVLTDGYTPWPGSPPRGMRVVAGLIGQSNEDVPEWIRAVEIAL